MVDVQDVVFIRNLDFKDNGKHDIKLNGHPALIIHANDEYIYFLKISSHPPKREKAQEQFFIEELGYINIKYIYKREKLGYQLYTYIPDDLFSEIIAKFNFYQINIYKDHLFDEINKNSLVLTRTKKHMKKTKKFSKS